MENSASSSVSGTQGADHIDLYTAFREKAGSKISYRVVLDEANQPRTLGLWGRFVRFLKDLRNTDQAKQQNEQVCTHFRDAIKNKYGEESARIADLDISTHLQHRSLRAKDVHRIMSEVLREVAKKETAERDVQIHNLEIIIANKEAENTEPKTVITSDTQSAEKLKAKDTFNAFSPFQRKKILDLVKNFPAQNIAEGDIIKEQQEHLSEEVVKSEEKEKKSPDKGTGIVASQDEMD